MSQGRIVERGTHPQLLAQQGLYAQMWERQQARSDEADESSGLLAAGNG
jgi:ATP-binding cassette subfamily B protein